MFVPAVFTRRLCALLSGGALSLSILGADAPIDFKRDIEPIFVKRCSECHGPDVQKAKLRLDSKEVAMKSGVIVPGKSSESELIKRVTTMDPDDHMPPKGAPLEPGQIAALKKWVDQGAVWPDRSAKTHWAFMAPQRPAVPSVKNVKWARTDIDKFILQRLEKESLKPNGEADRRTLIR